jgi:hypothetical protein
LDVANKPGGAPQGYPTWKIATGPPRFIFGRIARLFSPSLVCSAAEAHFSY